MVDSPVRPISVEDAKLRGIVPGCMCSDGPGAHSSYYVVRVEFSSEVIGLHTYTNDGGEFSRVAYRTPRGEMSRCHPGKTGT